MVTGGASAATFGHTACYKRGMRCFRFAFLTLFLVFLLPAGASTALWAVADRPGSWRAADWGSAALLPSAADEKDAVIHIMAARTGGLKGALSVIAGSSPSGQARTTTTVTTRSAGAIRCAAMPMPPTGAGIPTIRLS